jgi:hypothetical protein
MHDDHVKVQSLLPSWAAFQVREYRFPKIRYDPYTPVPRVLVRSSW